MGNIESGRCSLDRHHPTHRIHTFYTGPHAVSAEMEFVAYNKSMIESTSIP